MASSSSPFPELGARIAELRDRSDAWSQTSIEQRVALLEESLQRLQGIADTWVRTAIKARGVDPDSEHGQAVVAEEWGASILTMNRMLRLYIDVLTPAAKVWVQPGKEFRQASLYTELSREERAQIRGVSLILGAGNVNSISICDALDKLIVCNHVCLVKLNPVNDYSLPFLEQAFAPLVEDGYISFIRGGAAEGQYLCNHPDIDDIHITGSHLTHDAIVWGSPNDEQTAIRRERNEPLLQKPITSELGGVSPVIVVPGKWSEKDLDYQARNVVGMVTNNVSFNCVAAKVLILDADWELKNEFCERVKDVFRRIPARPAYYPGACSRYEKFLNVYGESAEAVSAGPLEGTLDSSEGTLDWLFVKGPAVEDALEDELGFKFEAFAPVLVQTEISSQSNPKVFLEKAARFCNDTLTGDLACTIIIDPETQRTCEQDLMQSIEILRYGTISINAFVGAMFAMGEPSWGGYPGNTIQRVGSGIGIVHNGFLIENVEKSVLFASFKMLLGVPAPWFPDHRRSVSFGKAASRYAANPGWISLIRAVWNALRG